MVAASGPRCDDSMRRRPAIVIGGSAAFLAGTLGGPRTCKRRKFAPAGHPKAFMKKMYIYEVIIGALLVGVVEAYFWTQGRTLAFGNATTKIALLALYVALVVGSQAALARSRKITLRDAMKGNLLVAVIVAVGLTALGFLLHPGVLKDVPANRANAVIVCGKFVATIGLATLILGTLAASVAVRLTGAMNEFMKLRGIR